MYQIHVQVTEYIGAIGVKATVSDIDADGHTSVLAGIPSRMFEPLLEDASELDEMFEVLERWARMAQSPRRVAPGVSPNSG